MAVEGRLHDAALHALATSVHEPHLGQTGPVRRGHELGHDIGDVARLEGVQVELALDRDLDGLLRHGVAQGEVSLLVGSSSTRCSDSASTDRLIGLLSTARKPAARASSGLSSAA